MHSKPLDRTGFATRRQAALALVGWGLAGCGGGGGTAAMGGTNPSPATPVGTGTQQSRSITSRATGTTYPLYIYLPPASTGPRNTLPVLYALDGDSWFATLVSIVQAAGDRVIIVAIDAAGQRHRDYVPNNACSTGGGGQANYLDFMLHELLPFVDSTIGGDTRQRLLFGHSHGGSFALYSLFSQAPGAQAFKSYLSIEASIGCLPNEAYAWEQAYAAAYTELPVRLHLSYASIGNAAGNSTLAGLIEQHHYTRLVFKQVGYSGEHSAIVPQAFTDGLAFGLATGA